MLTQDILNGYKSGSAPNNDNADFCRIRTDENDMKGVGEDSQAFQAVSGSTDKRLEQWSGMSLRHAIEKGETLGEILENAQEPQNPNIIQTEYGQMTKVASFPETESRYEGVVSMDAYIFEDGSVVIERSEFGEHEAQFYSHAVTPDAIREIAIDQARYIEDKEASLVEVGKLMTAIQAVKSDEMKLEDVEPCDLASISRAQEEAEIEQSRNDHSYDYDDYR
ncbi:MAG: hypothetical protein OSB62_02660 [Alphaproteobacteria bacterium]|nr:hypothetical protein [Alphaproteobacteria bacterium]